MDVTSEDFEINIGRAAHGKTFVRVIHLPTKKERSVVGFKGETYRRIVERLTNEIRDEIASSC